jgi:cellulose synthase/poly-beta-1,6-N-acetylglucosamine synthase-like glycosyltransferase
MFISTIVPTYRRPKDLARCLNALGQQTRSADEVIVVIRDSDNETRAYLEAFNLQCLPLHIVKVSFPGVVAAMNAGLDYSKGDIIAFTDDDAVSHSDWLEKIEAHFLSSKTIGGVGGRDRMYINGQLVKGEREIVGKLEWFGLAIGNHHLGYGIPREVDILKGVNMSFRRRAIEGMRFDERMRGEGAQVHFEMIWCLTLRQNGWKLIYDPQTIVDHFCAVRFDEDQRFNFTETSEINKSHNETLSLLSYFNPLQRVIFLIWSFSIGTSAQFGVLQWLRFLPKHGNLANRKFATSIYGRFQGWQTWIKTQ